jgi:hypothetical protein
MMRNEDTHLSDEKLMLLADGELGGREEQAIREHLAACSSCRLRMRELDDAIAEVASMHRDGTPLPPPDGPRTLLKARLRELAAGHRDSSAPHWLRSGRVAAGALCFAAGLILLIAVWLRINPSERVAIPRADLTPGAVKFVAASDVCRVSLGDNAEVMPAVQRQVFAEYGMQNAEAGAFEVDYLITPALGGSDDIRNLWPQPYAGSVWNAYVKDALEDRLRLMVCSGKLDLATAQHEIASNWVVAYQKYFHTHRPLSAHLRSRRQADRE